MEENRYLNNSDLNFERLSREKKMAKIVIVFACIGVFSGFLAFLTFFFHYKLMITPLFALTSGLIAALVVYIHVLFLKDFWQIWTYQLKYWYLAAGVLQACFVVMFILSIIMAVYNEQKLNVQSYYVVAVWIFMCWKWTFTIFYRSRKYRKMFTRYSLIGADVEEVNSE